MRREGLQMILRMGNNQKALLRCILSDYLEKNRGRAKTNKIVRREYNIVKGVYLRLIGRKRTCPKCGQEVKERR